MHRFQIEDISGNFNIVQKRIFCIVINYPHSNGLIMNAQNKFFVVAIGFSAGGRQDLYQFFSYLPKIPNAAFIVLHHLNRDYPSVADKLLAEHTNLSVCWAMDKMLIKPNHIYMLAPNKMMTIKDNYLSTYDRDPLDKSNWAVDIFFNSMAENNEGKGVGVILSGLGSDGSRGAVHIHKFGGFVLVQDPETAMFEGMPLSTIIRDNPDEILSPRKLALALGDYLSITNLS